MKVLLINGSPRASGNTALALEEMARVFEAEGVETEMIHVGNHAVRGCVACGGCAKKGRCVFDDVVNETAPKLQAADGMVVGSPVYYGGPNATVTAFLDRLFYSTDFDKSMKVGAALAICRRGGASAAFDRLNKYFTIAGMPVASGYYWNSVHGMRPGEAAQDEEGLRNARMVARNMAFLIKSIALGREKYGQPERESGPATNFIR